MNITKEQAKQLLSDISSSEENKQIRGLLELYIDTTISIEQLITIPSYQQFIQKNKQYITTMFIKTNNNQSDMITSLKEVFQEIHLKEKQIGSVQHVYIKLRAASGMTEMSQKMSRNEVKDFVKEIYAQIPNKNVEKEINNMITMLINVELFETDKHQYVYRVSLSLDSQKRLNISIEHDKEKTRYGFSGYFFPVTKKIDEIAHILNTHGYSSEKDSSKHLDDMIGPIIRILDNDDNDENEDISYT